MDMKPSLMRYIHYTSAMRVCNACTSDTGPIAATAGGVSPNAMAETVQVVQRIQLAGSSPTARPCIRRIHIFLPTSPGLCLRIRQQNVCICRLPSEDVSIKRQVRVWKARGALQAAEPSS